jgi:hypothetical protein
VPVVPSVLGRLVRDGGTISVTLRLCYYEMKDIIRLLKELTPQMPVVPS